MERVQTISVKEEEEEDMAGANLEVDSTDAQGCKRDTEYKDVWQQHSSSDKEPRYRMQCQWKRTTLSIDQCKLKVKVTTLNLSIGKAKNWKGAAEGVLPQEREQESGV